MHKATDGIDLDLTELYEWLSGFFNFEKQPSKHMFRLNTTKILCEKFGHPELACPCFHVTGSKGKGTIAANIAGALREAGYKTGVHASPHVLHFVERTGTGNGPFSMDVYDQAFYELKNGVEDLLKEGVLTKDAVSWYELTTVFSMLCFRIAKVDFAVYEVGMGGRLDATNVVTPLCAVFGPIELEHTKFLGNTLTKIATEKAGIIKPEIPAVSVWQKSATQKVLEKAAEDNQTMVQFLPKLENYLEQDAEVAKLALKHAGVQIETKAIENGIAKVSLPGRFEKLTRIPNYPAIPYILIDVAHTKNSMTQVCKRISKEQLTGNLIFGCALGKNVEAMAKIITNSECFQKIYITRPGDFKKSSLPEMEKAFDLAGANYVSDKNFKMMISRALEEANKTKTPLFVLGSFYLAGEVEKILGY